MIMNLNQLQFRLRKPPIKLDNVAILERKSNTTGVMDDSRESRQRNEDIDLNRFTYNVKAANVAGH